MTALSAQDPPFRFLETSSSLSLRLSLLFRLRPYFHASLPTSHPDDQRASRVSRPLKRLSLRIVHPPVERKDEGEIFSLKERFPQTTNGFASSK